MDVARLIEVLTITTPVFLLAGFGKILQMRGILTKENRKPLSWITYFLALPSLILSSFLTHRTTELLRIELLWLSLVGIIVPAAVVATISLFTKTPRETKMASIYGSYWGNNGYMGIPLAASALGSTGIALAAVINGIATPIFILSAVALMFLAKPHSHNPQEFRREAMAVIFHNPVLMALLIGMIFSFTAPYHPTIEKGTVPYALSTIFLALLKSLGQMGLPLALILVGSSLKFQKIQEDLIPLTLSVSGKLLIAPLAVVFCTHLWFPSLPKELLIAIVLLNAVPGAVAAYIIGDRFGVAPHFTSSHMVISTGFSIVSLPVWLYFLL